MRSNTVTLLKYSSFVLGSLLVIAGFITSKSYVQLVASVLLYPILVYLGLHLFPRKGPRMQKFPVFPKPKSDEVKVVARPMDASYIADIDRRAFLKLIGITGVSFFLFSVFGRRVEEVIFGKPRIPAVNETANGSGSQFGGSGGGSLTDGYKITEIDESETSNYFGFVNKDGAWLIMREETDNGSFRYTKGSSDFPGNWKNRVNLKYDYYHSLF